MGCVKICVDEEQKYHNYPGITSLVSYTHMTVIREHLQ